MSVKMCTFILYGCFRGLFIDCRVGYSRAGQRFTALAACAARAAMVLSAFITGVSGGIVNTETGATGGNLGFGQMCVWSLQGNMLIGSC